MPGLPYALPGCILLCIRHAAVLISLLLRRSIAFRRCVCRCWCRRRRRGGGLLLLLLAAPLATYAGLLLRLLLEPSPLPEQRHQHLLAKVDFQVDGCFHIPQVLRKIARRQCVAGSVMASYVTTLHHT